jgi:hypothetical protein
MSGQTTVSAQIIEVVRVRLRPARVDDIEGFVETQIDPRVRRFLGGPRADADIRAFVAAIGAPALTSSPGQYMVADATTDEMLGTILLTRRAAHLPGHVDTDSDELELTYVFRHRRDRHLREVRRRTDAPLCAPRLVRSRVTA